MGFNGNRLPTLRFFTPPKNHRNDGVADCNRQMTAAISEGDGQ